MFIPELSIIPTEFPTELQSEMTRTVLRLWHRYLRAVIGNIGSPEHLDYSAIGTSVNLAARLCGRAEAMSIVVSKALLPSIHSAGLKRIVWLGDLSK